MKSNKILFFSLCFLIGAKFNYLAAEIKGLRCEYNGSMEFVIKKSDAIDIERSLEGINCYDSFRLSQIKTGESGNGCAFCNYQLHSNYWVFLDSRIFIRITLIPNSTVKVFDHGDVYFYNVFTKSLSFNVDKVCYETKLKENLLINNGEEWIKLADFKPIYHHYSQFYQVILPPGYALKYPAGLQETITLETYDRK